MSQYLTFSLKNKKDNTIVTLKWFSTTPAREISSLGAFSYKDKLSILDKEIFNDYLEIVTNEKNKVASYHTKRLETIKDLKDSLLKATNAEVFKLLREELFEEESYLQESLETKEEWEYYVQTLEFIQDVWEENEKDWDLCYTNC